MRGAELQLNGRPVRLGGANRPSDDPKFGLLEPIEVVERDVRLMKAAGMELQRINHHAPPPALLDLADRLGLLIVPEAGNWQPAADAMDDPAMRADFENQMRELVERDWNHPSVVAWSVGNEYASDTPAGVRWTTDMVALVRKLDPSRLVTFASYRAFRPDLPRPEDEGSHVRRLRQHQHVCRARAAGRGARSGPPAVSTEADCHQRVRTSGRQGQE